MTGSGDELDQENEFPGVEIALAIRPRLFELLRVRQAREADRLLAELLARAAAGNEVSAEVRELLDRFTPTKEWVQAYLREGKPPAERSLAAPPPGELRVPVARPRICPICGYQQTPYAAGHQPRCPRHDTVLVPVREP